MHSLASSWAYWATARGDLKIKGGTWKSYFLPSDNIWAIVLHPDHEENEEAIREADAKQSVDEKASDVFLLMWRKDHVNFGVRPVHIEEHHVDKTLLIEPPVSLVKVLWNAYSIFLIHYLSTPLEEDTKQE